MEGNTDIENPGSTSAAPLRPPLLASLGTVLIDSFESPPRPKRDVAPTASASGPSTAGPLTTWPASLVSLPRASASTFTSSRPTSPSPLNPSVPLQIKTGSHRSRSRPNTGSSIASTVARPTQTRSNSDVSTPQRSFDSPLPSPTDEVWEVLGGGGMYALVGARVWLDPSELRCMVDRAPVEKGRDFPQRLEDQLNVFGEEVWCWHEGPDTKTIKSRLKYEGDTRFFEYINPPAQRKIEDLIHTPLFGSEYLHVSPPNSPEDLARILAELRGLQNSSWSPKIVFEPHPLSCKPESREALESVAPSIDVLSPNHEELLAFYGHSLSPGLDDIASLVEPLVDHLLHDIGVGRNGGGVAVIRCGGSGCCVGTRKGGIRWLPAYFEGEDQDRVIDVSGAGNSFLGGYVAGLHLSGGDPYEAALYATVSASFMVEQIGLPIFTTDASANLRWNGDDPNRRLGELRWRLEPQVAT